MNKGKLEASIEYAELTGQLTGYVLEAAKRHLLLLEAMNSDKIVHRCSRGSDLVYWNELIKDELPEIIKDF